MMYNGMPAGDVPMQKAGAQTTLKVPAMLLAMAIALVGLQLVPLPPALWTALPGREGLATAAQLAGFPQPWRPLPSLVFAAPVP